MPPALNTVGWANRRSYPALLSGHTPTLTPYKEQTCPPTPAQRVREQGNVLPVPTPAATAEAPVSLA